MKLLYLFCLIFFIKINNFIFAASEGQSNAHHSSLDALYFLFLCLLAGAFTLFIQKRFLNFFPYTCLMFLLGGIVGIAYAASTYQWKETLCQQSIQVEQYSTYAPTYAPTVTTGRILDDTIEFTGKILQNTFEDRILASAAAPTYRDISCCAVDNDHRRYLGGSESTDASCRRRLAEVSSNTNSSYGFDCSADEYKDKLMCQEINHPMGDLGSSIALWVAIDPHLLLTIFLPALIFADAMKVNIHLFRVCFWQCFLLACPGVLMTAGTMACVSFYLLNGVFQYNFDWEVSFIFGALLSATDPVSVVAMLESVSAPPKLTMLMSGESHLADLTSLVLFSLFLSLATATEENFEEASSTETISLFLTRMILGGPGIGLLFGFGALYSIRQNIAPQRNSDVMIQITITICVAYLSFIVSENNAGSNGVLASVTAAVVIAAYAWPSFASIETMENVWHAIEYFGNTIIFALAGLIFGNIIYEYSAAIQPAQYGHVFIVYLILYASRFVMILLFYPLLAKMGYGLKANEAATMVWGGLRGAVAVTLGIVVLNSEVRSNLYVMEVEERAVFFFLIGGVVFFSLIINSTTTPLLMKVTKVLSRSSVKKQLLHHVHQRIRAKAEKTFKEVTKEDEFSSVKRAVVEYACSSLKPIGEKGNWGKRIKSYKHDEDIDNNKIDADDQVVESEAELLAQVRELFLDALRAAYWEQIEEGILPRNSSAAQALLQSCELAKDKTDEILCDLDYLGLPESLEDDENRFTERFFKAIDDFLPDWVTIDDYFGDKVHEQERHEAVYKATCFINAHLVAQNRVAEYVGEGDDVDTPEEETVINESIAQVDRAKNFMKLAQDVDPHIVELIKAKKVASTILQHESELVNELRTQGIIDARTALEFNEHLRADTVTLMSMNAAALDSIGNGSNTKSIRTTKSKSNAVSTKVKQQEKKDSV